MTRGGADVQDENTVGYKMKGRGRFCLSRRSNNTVIAGDLRRRSSAFKAPTVMDVQNKRNQSMPPKRAPQRASRSEPLERRARHYDMTQKNRQVTGVHGATQRLRILRALVFAGPLLIASSVSIV